MLRRTLGQPGEHRVSQMIRDRPLQINRSSLLAAASVSSILCHLRSRQSFAPLTAPRLRAGFCLGRSSFRALELMPIMRCYSSFCEDQGRALRPIAGSLPRRENQLEVHPRTQPSKSIDPVLVQTRVHTSNSDIYRINGLPLMFTSCGSLPAQR
jgi:hypothetical protein